MSESLTSAPQADRGTSLTVLIPALNEAHAIEVTVREVLQHARAHLKEFAILLVDDGSTDETGAIMDRVAAQNSAISVVHNKAPQGVGAAFATLLRTAKTSHVTVVPGDHAYREDGVRRLFQAVGSARLVISYRDNQESRSRLRSWQSHIMRVVLNMLFGYPLHDFHSMVIYPAAELRELDIDAKGYAYQIEAIISLLQLGTKYAQLPVSLNKEIRGSSRAVRPRTYFALARAVLRLLLRVPTRSYRAKLARGEVVLSSPPAARTAPLLSSQRAR